MNILCLAIFAAILTGPIVWLAWLLARAEQRAFSKDIDKLLQAHYEHIAAASKALQELSETLARNNK